MNKLARVAAPLAALALLAGCSNNPQVAFSINGESTRIEAVRQAAADCSLSGEGSELTMAAILLEGQLAEQVAKKADVAISDEAADNALIQGAGYTKAKFSTECWNHLRGQGRYMIVGSNVGRDGWIKAVKDVDVVVNPVFGATDPQIKLLTGKSGSLSQPGSNYGVAQGNGK